MKKGKRNGSLMKKLLLTIVPLVIIAVLIVMGVSIKNMREELQEADMHR